MSVNLLAAAGAVPVLGTVASGVETVASVVGIHSSAAAPNQAAADAISSAALDQGNVVAWKAAYKRKTYITVPSSAQPWSDLWSKIVQKYPGAASIAGDGPTKPQGVPEEWIVNVAPEQVPTLVSNYSNQLGAKAFYSAYVPAGGGVPTSGVPQTSGGAAGPGPTVASFFAGSGMPNLSFGTIALVLLVVVGLWWASKHA